MVFVKILGTIDLAGALAFLMIVFGLQVWTPYLLFCGGLLLVKGLFIFGGDVLSAIDIYSSVFLVLSIFFGMPIFLIWTGAFLLLAKGFVSFI